MLNSCLFILQHYFAVVHNAETSIPKKKKKGEHYLLYDVTGHKVLEWGVQNFCRPFSYKIYLQVDCVNYQKVLYNFLKFNLEMLFLIRASHPLQTV
jgi:hypothetical protein